MPKASRYGGRGRSSAQKAAARKNLEKARASRKKGSVQASMSKPLGKQAHLNRIINRHSKRSAVLRSLGATKGLAFKSSQSQLKSARRRKKAKAK